MTTTTTETIPKKTRRALAFVYEGGRYERAEDRLLVEAGLLRCSDDPTTRPCWWLTPLGKELKPACEHEFAHERIDILKKHLAKLIREGVGESSLNQTRRQIKTWECIQKGNQ